MEGTPAPDGSPGSPEIAHAYDRWAPSYDIDRNATRDLDAAVLRRSPVETAGRDVVELGCGTGKNTVWLAEHARRVIAMDFSAGMLTKARARVVSEHVRFVRHDVREPWPLLDATADVVIGTLVLEHVGDVARVYAEAARVLRGGGQLYLCELHPYRQWLGRQANFTDTVTGETVLVPARVHSVGEYVNGALAAGFALRHVGEWRESDARADASPRLLSLLFERR